MKQTFKTLALCAAPWPACLQRLYPPAGIGVQQPCVQLFQRDAPPVPRAGAVVAQIHFQAPALCFGSGLHLTVQLRLGRAGPKQCQIDLLQLRLQFGIQGIFRSSTRP